MRVQMTLPGSLFSGVLIGLLLCQVVDASSVVHSPRVMLVTDSRPDTILKYDAQSGDFLGVFADASTGLDIPGQMLIHPARSSLLVTNFGSDEVLEFDLESGSPLGTFASENLLSPIDLGVHPLRNTLLVSGRDNRAILEYSLDDGSFIQTLTSADSVSFAFGFQTDLALGQIYLANYEYEGVFVAAGDGGLEGPGGFLILPVPEASVATLALAGGSLLLIRRKRTPGQG